MAEDQDEIVKRAKDAYTRDKDYWRENYLRAQEDQHFLSDDPYAQWDPVDFTQRITTGRPAITVDQLSQFVHQVANDIRINTPTINIIPAGKDSDVETAEIFKGLIKNIEYQSGADSVYDIASLNSIRSGFGFIRVDHDYEDDESFNQKLLIKAVVNPLSCWIDADSIECDGRDARHGTIVDRMTVSKFKELYPGKDPVCFDQSDRPNLRDDDWVTIAEHFVLKHEEVEMALDDYGATVPYQEGVPFKTKRTIRKTKVMRYKLSGKEVLEETTFPGKYIPLVPVWGEEFWVDGKRHLLSLIRRAKDAQRQFNYWKSIETELLAKMPMAPIMAAEGQIDNYKKDWLNPSKAMVLRYKTVDADGNPIGAPQRLEPPMPPTGVINAARGAVDDIKATMGLYNASIGQRSNETSGIAIQQRQEEGDVATFHFADNLVRSICQVGRVLVCAIPEIYDTPRVIRITGMEDEPKEIGINGEIVQDQEREFDLRKGKYDVKVVTGASYTTRRQEAAQFFSDIVAKQPQLMEIMGDLLFKNMDFNGAQAMAERMKKVINPKFLEGTKDAPPPDPEKIQMAQQLQLMQAELAKAQQQLQSKQGELLVKEQDNQIKASADQQKTNIELMKLDLERRQMELEAQFKAAEIEIKNKELLLKEQELIVKAQQEQERTEAEYNQANQQEFGN